MTFNLWTFLLEAVNFLVLAWILKRLLYQPLRDAIDKRRAAHEQAQAQAEQARDEARTLQQQIETELSGLDRKRQDVLRQAHEQAAADRRKLLDDAEQSVRQKHEAAQATIAHERDEALKALRSEVIQQAVDLSRRLLTEAADGALDERLADRLVEKLEQLPAEARQQLQSHWHPQDPAVLETARELNHGACQRIATALESVLGRSPELSVQPRSDLLAGVRLRVGGQVWDASLAGQFEGISDAIEGSRHHA